MREGIPGVVRCIDFHLVLGVLSCIFNASLCIKGWIEVSEFFKSFVFCVSESDYWVESLLNSSNPYCLKSAAHITSKPHNPFQAYRSSCAVVPSIWLTGRDVCVLAE